MQGCTKVSKGSEKGEVSGSWSTFVRFYGRGESEPGLKGQ